MAHFYTKPGGFGEFKTELSSIFVFLLTIWIVCCRFLNDIPCRLLCYDVHSPPPTPLPPCTQPHEPSEQISQPCRLHRKTSLNNYCSAMDSKVSILPLRYRQERIANDDNMCVDDLMFVSVFESVCASVCVDCSIYKDQGFITREGEC
jgi:hypothetical protein